MYQKTIKYTVAVASLVLLFAACKAPDYGRMEENTSVPESYSDSKDSTNSGQIQWKTFFTDSYLHDLIDTALKNNQELNIMLMEIQTANNEVRAKKGEYLPSVGIGAGAGTEKVGRYTSQGANDANTEIKPGEEFPDPLPDYNIGLYANWELDIWKKLRNAKKSALMRYLSTIEGKNFMVTNLIAEISNAYYELLALDNQLLIVQQNIEIQSNALKVVKQQKLAARVSELAVRKFEAEVFHTRSLQFDIQQKITITENKINFLLGRFPQPIPRSAERFSTLIPDTVYAGVPSQLLENRTDVRQAELELAASKLDVKVAKARFYPTIGITAGVGYQAFNPQYLIQSPQSLMYSIAGDLMAPLINRNAIKAQYYSANAKQVQAIFNYERTILNAYIEVANQLSNISNLEKSYALKNQEVQALIESITISNNLFKSARADYMEVLLTQRDALESRFELIETKKQQMNAMVNMYQALGGGWN